MPAQETPTPSGPDAPDEPRAEDAAAAEEPGAAPAANPGPDLAGHLAAAPLIARFGGIRPMAHKLGVPVSTVQGWKQRGAIPASRLGELRAAAESHGISLDDADLAPVEEKPVAEPEPPRRAAPPPPPPAPPVVPPARGGTGAVVLALLALVVAVGVGGLVLYGDWQMGADPRVAALEERLDDALARPAESGALAERIDDALAELGAVRTELDAHIDSVADQPADTGALTERLAALENAVWDIESKIETLATALGNLPPAIDLAPLQDTLASLAQRADALDGDVIALNQQVARLVETTQAATATAQQGLTVAAGEIAALRAELDTVAATAGRADAGSARAVALSVAARQLAAAVGAGTPYTAERDALATLAGDDAAIAEALGQLGPAAATGIAPFHVLKARFPAVARASVQAARAADDADWLDRAMSRATEIVAVRRVDPADPGDYPVAVVARAENHLDAGDLKAAADEMARLTGAAADAAAAWLADARARLAAATALAAIERRVLALLDAAG